MILSAIVAASENDVIGNSGQIPWKLAGDSAYVKKMTMGKPLIMGSTTHNSIGRVLPGRANIVISRKQEYKPADGAVAVQTIDEALNLDEIKNAPEVIIFGGQVIYELAMPKVQRIYLTRVHAVIEGDTFFKYNPDEWQEISIETHKKDKDNEYDYDFIVLERKKA